MVYYELLILLTITTFTRSTLASHPHSGHSVRTPAHLLANRTRSFPRSLLEGQLTVGKLFNVSIEVGSSPTNSTSAPPETINSSLPASPAAPSPLPTSRASCFPFSARFSAGKVPAMTRDEWWCRDEDMYGFLGFSYPLEIADCSDPSNQYPKLKQDLLRMRDEFGATFVRPYGVECRATLIWLNLVRACIELGMALIVQVWWGFQSDQDLWKKGQETIYELFENSTYAQIAPYVVYSASFGSEPVGDWVDGDRFPTDLASFRTKMNSFGIPVGISEDWDRPNRMREGAEVIGMGAAVLNDTDVAQLHVMPYYHPDEVPSIDGSWDYVETQVRWARTALKQPTMITETMWSSQQGGSHGRGSNDDQSTLENFQQYWVAFSSNCEFFKEQQTGYFVHTYDDSMEPYFGMIDSDGKTKIDGWKPRRC